MMRLLFTAVAISVAVVLLVETNGPGTGPRAAAAGPGPQIVVGAPALVGGKVHVAVSAAGSGFDPYKSFSIHMRWDPAIFSPDVGGTSTAGTIIPSAFCPPPSTAIDVDGGGVVVACTGLGGSTSATGLLATISMTPLVVSGCSALHLFTFGAPDGGTAGSGTFTGDATLQSKPQLNTYLDGTANVAGATCTVPGTPTSTPTATVTPTPSPSPTPSATPSPTPTPLTGYPDVTVAAFSSPSDADSGTTVAYSFVISNGGTATAHGVQLDITIPLGAVPLKSAACKTYVSGHFFCSLPDLAGGMQEATVLNMNVPITTNAASAVVAVHVSASNEPPANQGNNNAQVTTTVRGCPDLDGDGRISIIDFSIAASSFGLHQGQPGYNPLADQDGDNAITILDLNIMAARYLQACKGLDSDHDGISNSDEINIYHTDPMNPDTDGDGLPDGVEVYTYGSNPLVVDTDGDGYTDAEEAALGKDPTVYCQIMASDLDHDHTVTIIDLSDAALSYLLMTGQPGFNPAADLNHDGHVDIVDISIIAGNYLRNVSECP